MKASTVFNKLVFKAIDYGCDPQCNWGRVKGKRKGLIIDKEIVYDPSDEFGKLDLYYYKQSTVTPRPVMFYIHGGGFVGGDKKFRRALSSWYAAQGLFVVNINYGLAPARKFPKPVIDCVNALNWIVDNAEKYSLDLNRIFISGDSAGGYYAAMTACVTCSPKLQSRLGVTPRAKIYASVLNCGLYDIDQALGGKVLFDMGDKIAMDFAGIKASKLKDYEFYDVISPIHYVDAHFPPSFVIYADQDFFCGGHGPLLCQKLNDLGVYYESINSTKFLDNHCYSLFWNKKASKICNGQVKKFIAKALSEDITKLNKMSQKEIEENPVSA